jgi:hypothetical protein
MQCPSGGIMRGLQKSSQRLKGICSAGGLRVPTRNQAIKTGGGKAWNMIESINSIAPRPLNGTARFRVWAFLCFFFLKKISYVFFLKKNSYVFFGTLL